MNLEFCLFFIIVFYPGTLLVLYYTKRKAALAITIFSILVGMSMTYGFYNDSEFWRGWVHSWYRSAQLGFGHSAVLSCVYYWIAWAGGWLEVKNNR